MDLHESAEKIYTDFNFTDFSTSSFSENPLNKQGLWGVYNHQPVAQTQWSKMVEVAAAQAAEVKSDCSTDVRPHVYDRRSKQWLMLDSGAAVSIWPKRLLPEAMPTTNALRAVNGTKISTFGNKNVTIDLAHQNFTHSFVVAEVPTPILGWDFLVTFKLDLRWQGARCALHDARARRKFHLRFTEVAGSSLNLAPVETSLTFQKWSQHKAQENQLPKQPFPTLYQNLLNKFPDIQTCDFVKQPAHGVVHTINTGNNRPCKARPRPLMPGTPKAILGEKSWRKLETLGIIEKVDPSETNIWTSALHLVPKPDGTLRCTGDYRALNDKTELDAYPLPSIRHFVHKLKGSTIFSKGGHG